MVYCTPNSFSAFDLHLFGQGTHWELYRLLGAHPCEENGQAGYRFAVWAPNARGVFVAGDFTNWSWDAAPLQPVENSGIWAGFLPGVQAGQRYKFGILTAQGTMLHKADPFAFQSELRPGTASITAPCSSYKWNDDAWLRQRGGASPNLQAPVSIYEVHAGSWRKKGEARREWLSYSDMASTLVPYVRDLGFTHIECMPLAEHPLDESWGYQTGQYFAPTSRFGTPDDLRFFVDACHQAGLGVLLDWVPAHFPKDAFGLSRFDGTALYEYADPCKGEHPDWGTLIFNYGSNQVRNFLIANALYWLKEFHFDGLRVDAVTSMLYLDYSRKPGDWAPNNDGGHEHREAAAFMQELNTQVQAQVPGCLIAAEESSTWPGVTRPVAQGGLGFGAKWNMGWMHDTLNYMRIAPQHRKNKHNALTFSLTYAFSERFLLPLSHDEVVHGKGSLLAKMPGSPSEKLAGLRLLYAYMWAHPGKKLLFMGGELGQWTEWDASGELDWALLENPGHAGLSTLLRDLNALLRGEAAMHQCDHSWQGFAWLDCRNNAASVYSFLRSAPGQPPLLWAFNFSAMARQRYAIPCPVPGAWQVRLNTDSCYYGGCDRGDNGLLHSSPGMVRDKPLPGVPHSAHLLLTLPPLTAVALQAAGGQQ